MSIVMMIEYEVLIYFFQISNRSCVSVFLSPNCYFPPSWAPQARSEAWEVYPQELYPPDDPPRPGRPKAGLGLVMIMMKTVMMGGSSRWGHCHDGAAGSDDGTFWETKVAWGVNWGSWIFSVWTFWWLCGRAQLNVLVSRQGHLDQDQWILLSVAVYF